MNRIALVTILVSCAVIINTSCGKNEPKDKEEIVGIENISFENFPKMDGSTSCKALNEMIACKLLGIRYEWDAFGYMGFRANAS